MDAKEIRDWQSETVDKLNEILKQDEALSPTFWGALTLVSFQALTEIAAQLSELQTKTDFHQLSLQPKPHL